MTGHTILNDKLRESRIHRSTHLDAKSIIEKKYQHACQRREEIQSLVEKLEMQLREEKNQVNKYDEFIIDEEKCRVKLHRLLRVNDDLHMEEWTDYSVKVWLGEWEEDMECQDTWKDALQHAEYLLKNKS